MAARGNCLKFEDFTTQKSTVQSSDLNVLVSGRSGEENLFTAGLISVVKVQLSVNFPAAV